MSARGASLTGQLFYVCVAQGTMAGEPDDIQHAQPEADERVAAEGQQTAGGSSRRT